jgi:hypothetical protein
MVIFNNRSVPMWETIMNKNIIRKVFLVSIFISITALLIILNASALGIMAVSNSNMAAQGYDNVGEASTVGASVVNFATWNNLAASTLIILDKKIPIMISNPTKDQVFIKSPITVKGTVSDKIDVEFVEVRVGSGPWIRAIGTTFWTVSSISLTEGSNTITARAADTTGN